MQIMHVADARQILTRRPRVVEALGEGADGGPAWVSFACEVDGECGEILGETRTQQAIAAPM